MMIQTKMKQSLVILTELNDSTFPRTKWKPTFFSQAKTPKWC